MAAAAQYLVCIAVSVLAMSCSSVWAGKSLNPRQPGRMGSGGLKGVAVLVPGNNSKVQGTITFEQMPDQLLIIRGNITGLADGEHGFHVHEFGDLSNGCTSMAAHFNPADEKHGARDAADGHRHVGDLGNIQSKGGLASIQISDRLVTLFPGVTSIIGRGLVVHEKLDDLGKGGNEESLKTGNAGGRLACGVIGYQQGSKAPPAHAH